MKPGDVVRLRSGGDDMTVESIDAAGRVHCVWFAEIANFILDEVVYPIYATQPTVGTFVADTLEQVS